MVGKVEGGMVERTGRAEKGCQAKLQRYRPVVRYAFDLISLNKETAMT